jgi:hypothetical protein
MHCSGVDETATRSANFWSEVGPLLGDEFPLESTIGVPSIASSALSRRRGQPGSLAR